MRYVRRDGFFTTSRYLLGNEREALERTLGYRKGLLDAGFDLGALADDQVLAANDFLSDQGSARRRLGSCDRKLS
jgi:hypothetical protein